MNSSTRLKEQDMYMYSYTESSSQDITVGSVMWVALHNMGWITLGNVSYVPMFIVLKKRLDQNFIDVKINKK
jgi:hypothetical protein